MTDNSSISTLPPNEEGSIISTPPSIEMAAPPLTTINNLPINASAFSGAEIGLWICILIAVVVLVISSSVTSTQYWDKDNLLMSVFIAIVGIALFNSWTVALLSSKIPWYIAYVVIIASFYFLVVAIIIGYKTQNNPEDKKGEDTSLDANVATMAGLITILALLLFNGRIIKFVMLFIRHKTPNVTAISESGINFIMIVLFFTGVASLLALDNKFLKKVLKN
jgi:hypothetical protein